jgi:aryl-phospho-beta-D-glucosidase BglC (GH1 family)
MGFVRCVTADQPPLIDTLQATTLPAAKPCQLPRWRGFNVLDKFDINWHNRPFRVQDFQWIHELGFNFVGLPMDYRCWIVDGDWLRLDQIGLKIQDKQEHVLSMQTQWDQQSAQICYQPMHIKNPFTCSKVEGRQWFKQTTMTSWLALQQQGVGVMVGEFGCYNRTPHAVALAWMEDCLANWKQANWGWALWNFRGSFGILDSHRRDVDYENFHGHKLDRQMLDLLQKY